MAPSAPRRQEYLSLANALAPSAILIAALLAAAALPARSQAARGVSNTAADQPSPAKQNGGVIAGAVTLAGGDRNLRTAVIEAGNGDGYFGTTAQPGRLVKAALGKGGEPPSQAGLLTLKTGEDERLALEEISL